MSGDLPLRAPLPWNDPFDEALAAAGPPAIFTVDHKGQLRLAADRTRDAWSRVEGAPERGERHCLFRDRATGWVQYALVTSPALCAAHPRAEIAVYPSQAEALDALAALGRPPVCEALP